MAEKIIKIGKKGGEVAYLELGRIFYSHEASRKTINELSPRFKDTRGGYVRITKLDKRRVDKAQMARIEYVGNYLDIYEKEYMDNQREKSEIPDRYEWQLKIYG